MRRKWFIIVIALLILVAAGFFLVPSLFSGPMYSPGDLSTDPGYQSLLKESPEDTDSNYFRLANDISLYYEIQEQASLS